MLILAFEANSAVTLLNLFRILAHCVKVKNFRKFQSAYCKQQTYIIISNKGNIILLLFIYLGDCKNNVMWQCLWLPSLGMKVRTFLSRSLALEEEPKVWEVEGPLLDKET